MSLPTLQVGLSIEKTHKTFSDVQGHTPESQGFSRVQDYFINYKLNMIVDTFIYWKKASS